MVGVIDNISGLFITLYDSSLALNVFVVSVILAIVSLFIWRFYKSTSKRNLIELNLSKYNYSNHPLTSKFFATLFYLIEYVIIMPILIILWYAGLSVVLLLMGPEGVEVGRILFIAAILIAAIRILAYFHSEISKDLAKLFPFIALATFILSFEVLQSSSIRVFEQIKEIPALFSNIFSFIFVILAIEIALRFLYTMFAFWASESREGGGHIKKDDEEE